ncbi:YbaN family protein [Lysobacter sp. A421]
MPDRAPIPDPPAPALPLAPSAPVASRLRWAWWLVAYLSLGLGLVGVVVPGLPTVPFVLLSAYAAARGSARLYRWLLAHALFGPMIVDWQRGGTVARRAKWWASLSMAVCAVVMFLTAPQWWMAGTGTGVMALVAGWLWLRPEPPIR